MAIYFRVYQNKEETNGDSFIIPFEKLEITAEMDIECIQDGTLESPCVFEPIEMTKEEFDNLPEFDGF